MKSYVVTGGARGIGKSVVENLAKLPSAQVFYSYFNNPNPELDVLDNVYSFKCDNSSEDGCRQFAEFVLSKSKKVHCLVNNVGVASFELLNNTSLETWDEIHKTNFFSALTMYSLLRSNLLSNESKIINISSIVATRPKKGTGAYASSKHLLSMASEAMEAECKHQGIDVCTIAPGFILTETLSQEKYRDIREKNIRDIPGGKFGKEGDIGILVARLVGENLRLSSKRQIHVNGGQHLLS